MREKNLDRFKRGDAQVIVATDVAARGIHVDGISLVVHFDAPTDPKAYLHRSGRTARAGVAGTVITLTVRKKLDEVRRLQRQAGVEAKHHDSRTAPRPMTVEALGEAVGETFSAERPQSSSPGKRTYGNRPQGGARPHRKYEGRKTFESKHSDKPAAKKPYEKTGNRPTGKPATGQKFGTKSGPKTGAKARWSGAEKRAR